MLWTLSSNYFLSHFYELVIQLQVDISNLHLRYVLMLPEFGPESGALATVGEFVSFVLQ